MQKLLFGLAAVTLVAGGSFVPAKDQMSGGTALCHQGGSYDGGHDGKYSSGYDSEYSGSGYDDGISALSANRTQGTFRRIPR